jgi:hypothetical protein
MPPANAVVAAVPSTKAVRGGGGATSSNSSGCWSALTGDEVDLTNGLENLSCSGASTVRTAQNFNYSYVNKFRPKCVTIV